MKKETIKLPIFSVISGIGLWLSWPPLPLFGLIFFAFIPLLLASDSLKKRSGNSLYFFGATYLALLIWNTSTLSWLYNFGIWKGIMIHVLNALIFSLPFLIFHYFNQKNKKKQAYILLISAWMILEYLHYNWQLAFPFLSLGNSIAMYPKLAQWYEFTGVQGGSLWIWLVNIGFYESFRKKNSMVQFKVNSSSLFYSIALVVIPVVCSLYLFHTYEIKANRTTVEVVSIHPDLDCKTEKYQLTDSVLIEKYLALSKTKVTAKTDYLIWPETAIPNAGWVHALQQDTRFNQIKYFLNQYPKLKLITGAIIYNEVPEMGNDFLETSSLSVRKLAGRNIFYTTYNVALQMQAGQKIMMRTKQDLVPFEEKTPYPYLLKIFRSSIEKLGGFEFSSKSPDQIFKTNAMTKVAPLICYESIFGANTAKLVKKGANILFVLLNEGWYNDKKGAAQFMYHSALRAIENRRAVARSSNRGVSCFINERGEVVKKLTSFSADALKYQMTLNNKKTFYTLLGDWIGNIAIFLFVVIFLKELWVSVNTKLLNIT